MRETDQKEETGKETDNNHQASQLIKPTRKRQTNQRLNKDKTQNRRKVNRTNNKRWITDYSITKNFN